MSDWWKIAFGLVCGLLAVGLILLVSGAPRGEAIALLPQPTPAPIMVHVAGAVAQPGVYSLPAKSRVQDAIQAAGGLQANADQHSLNLAAFVQDGERVLIAAIPPTPPVASPNSQAAPGSSTSAPQIAPAIVYPININTATQAELESLPGIGPITAQKIIQYREQHGPFKSIEEIMDVPDIGQKTFDQIKELITV